MRNFDQSLPMLLYRALNALMPEFRAIFRQFGLTERQWRVLRVLWEEDGRPLLALAERTLIPAPSLIGVVDRLRKGGLVERRRSATDRRVVQIWLTDGGRALQAEVTPLVDRAYAAFDGFMDPEEWRALTAMMDKIASRANGAGDPLAHKVGDEK